MDGRMVGFGVDGARGRYSFITARAALMNGMGRDGMIDLLFLPPLVDQPHKSIENVTISSTVL
jgi:hypothetical protein